MPGAVLHSRAENRMRSRIRPAGVILMSFAAIAALSMPGLGNAATTAGAPAVSWPSQVARPGPASCPRGEMLIAPTSGWTDALGVAHLTYRAAPGLVAAIPPRGLTARQVTPAVLADLDGGVGRSASPRRDERLVRLFVRLAKDRTAPEFCQAKPADAHASRRRSGSELPSTHIYSGNWGGYAVTESEFGAGINGVTGSWSVPANSGTGTEAESTWVGIGGNIGGEKDGFGLIQAGTEMAFVDQSGKQFDGFYTFFQWAGSNTCVGAPLSCGMFSSADAVVPGDNINAYVWWNTSTTATFVLETPEGSWDLPDYPVGVIYDHTSAEWVNENHLPTPYDKPGTVQFTNQELSSSFSGDGGFVSPFEGSYEAIIMKNMSTTATSCSDGNGVMSYPAYPGNSSSGGSSDIITCPDPGPGS
jgi:hypothetical protein